MAGNGIKMTILHTETLKKWGGQQNRVLEEACGLSQRGHRAIIACHKGSVLAEKSKKAGIKVYELNMVKNGHLKTVPQLINIIKTEKVDIVSTHSSVDSWAGGLAAWFSDVRLVRFRHNLYPIGRDPLTKLIYSLPDKIIAISDTVNEALLNCGIKPGKMSTISDAVDMEKFNPDAEDIRGELGISEDTLVIGNTSTFVEVKGPEYLLQAFNIINEKIPCVLMFAGRLVEPHRSRYLSYVKPEFRDKVIFLGHRDDVPRVLKTIDVFVYPSLFEGLGTALLEAMAMGKAVAVSDIPTFRSFVINNENGLYFKVKDPENLAEKTLSLLTDKDLREELGKNARATALELFSREKMIDITEAQYMEVINAV